MRAKIATLTENASTYATLSATAAPAMPKRGTAMSVTAPQTTSVIVSRPTSNAGRPARTAMKYESIPSAL